MLLLTYLSLQTAEPPDLNSKIVPDRCRAASIREDEIVGGIPTNRAMISLKIKF